MTDLNFQSFFKQLTYYSLFVTFLLYNFPIKPMESFKEMNPVVTQTIKPNIIRRAGQKIVEYAKNVANDYKTVAIETVTEAPQHPLRSTIFVSTLGTIIAAACTNPTETQMWNRIAEWRIEMGLVPNSIHSTLAGRVICIWGAWNSSLEFIHSQTNFRFDFKWKNSNEKSKSISVFELFVIFIACSPNLWCQGTLLPCLLLQLPLYIFSHKFTRLKIQISKIGHGMI